MTTTTVAPDSADESDLSLAPAPQRGFSTSSLVLGVASILFGFTFFVPLAAVICGIIGLRKEPESKPMALAGLITGAISFLAWLALYVFFILATLAFTFIYFMMIFVYLAQSY